MGIVQLTPWRFRVEEFPNRRLLVIPAEREFFALWFTPVWMAGWVVGEVWALLVLLTKALGVLGVPIAPNTVSTALVVFWFVGWTCAGCVVALSWLWMLIGVETVEIGGECVRIRRRMLGYERMREYSLDRVSCLRVVRVPDRKRFTAIYQLRFDYGGKIVEFARRKNQSELIQIASSIGQRHPSMIAPR